MTSDDIAEQHNMIGDDEGQAALDDVFASGRDRGADSAAPAPEATPPPKPELDAKDAPTPGAEAEGKDGDPKQYRDPETGRFVPLTELKTERQKRQEETRLRTEAEQRAIAAEARAEEARRYAEQVYRQQQQYQQPQQQQEPIDPWTDPDGYRRDVETKARMVALNERLNMSQMLAEEKHGTELVQKALNEAAKRGVAQDFVNTRNPYVELVTWYQRMESLNKIGDPVSFEQRVRDEERKKVLAELKAGPPQQQRYPGTLADAPAAGAQGAMMSDQAMMDQIYSSDRSKRRSV